MNDYYGKMGKDMSDKITATSNNFIQLPIKQRKFNFSKSYK